MLVVSRKAAETLGFIQLGRARVRLEVLAWP
jgi:rare lipoprotein A (peptidoglycan hydrolase)